MMSNVKKSMLLMMETMMDDGVQQSISKLDESALTDMMSQVEKRAREVCALALVAMKQRQE
eukprot:1141882-Ditylum_brightwellii.AAC.1